MKKLLVDVAVIIGAAFIAVLLGSLIAKATNWDRQSAIAGTLAGIIVCLFCVRAILKSRRQRRQSQDQS